MLNVLPRRLRRSCKERRVLCSASAACLWGAWRQHAKRWEGKPSIVAPLAHGLISVSQASQGKQHQHQLSRQDNEIEHGCSTHLGPPGLSAGTLAALTANLCRCTDNGLPECCAMAAQMR